MDSSDSNKNDDKIPNNKKDNKEKLDVNINFVK